uniref:ABC transporter related protein (MsmX, msmK) n=1 Tax=uncultured marine thaumarchaeote KM3_86_F11 TaxID=1456322 RepID=A0A075HUC2_9ARCH|nr:ABC transporter related protein (msmX, msmK) [uncultured marine thaumarchaeote KM3_86_F11]|tara:strand:- start:456 stop:1472 length:1017 start_codon:yes stop_codon:yes gene_type:complete
MDVILKKVSKRFTNADVDAVNQVDLEIVNKEFLVILGPSGSGKSSLLRLIAGLEEVSGGEVYFGNELMNDVSPRERDISMVFQNFALFPNMTVYDNIAFPIRASGKDSENLDSEVKRIASMLQIEGLLDRKPGALSGGEQQRVSLGRAIIKKPKIFLMDEPLSNLDASLRSELRAEIKKLHKELGITFIYVTHDQTEAMTMADRIALIKDGKLLQVDKPEVIYNDPNHSWIGSFLGMPAMNLVSPSDLGDSVPSKKGASVIGIRPENINISTEKSKLSGSVISTEYLGDSKILNVQVGNAIMKAKVSNDSTFSVGADVNLDFSDDDLRFFTDDGKNLG